MAYGFSRPSDSGGYGDYIQGRAGLRGTEFLFDWLGIDAIMAILFLAIGYIFITSYANSRRETIREEIRVGEIKRKKDRKKYSELASSRKVKNKPKDQS